MQHPFPRHDTSARGLGEATPHLQLGKSQEHVAAGGGNSSVPEHHYSWLLGEGQGEWLLLATRCPWEKGQDSSASLWHRCACLCRKLPCSPSQALGPPDCTLTMMVTHPSSQSTSALRPSHWGQGTRPLSRGRDSLSRLASPGLTHGRRRRGVMDLPTQESQPPLCMIVSGYAGAERCLVSL